MVKILPCGRLPNLKRYLGLLPGEKEDLDGTLSVPQYQGQISWDFKSNAGFWFQSQYSGTSSIESVFSDQ